MIGGSGRLQAADWERREGGRKGNPECTPAGIMFLRMGAAGSGSPKVG